MVHKVTLCDMGRSCLRWRQATHGSNAHQATADVDRMHLVVGLQPSLAHYLMAVKATSHRHLDSNYCISLHLLVRSCSRARNAHYATQLHTLKLRIGAQATETGRNYRGMVLVSFVLAIERLAGASRIDYRHAILAQCIAHVQCVPPSQSYIFFACLGAAAAAAADACIPMFPVLFVGSVLILLDCLQLMLLPLATVVNSTPYIVSLWCQHVCKWFVRCMLIVVKITILVMHSLT